jgi:hypothetical protein
MRDYRERLHAPLSWWLLAIPVVVLLGGELYAGVGGAAGVAAFTIFGAGCALALLALGAAKIEVDTGRLKAGGAVLPLRYAGEVVPVNEKQFARLRGPQANPAARLVLRPYLRQAVFVAVHDPADRAPYWLIGTRRPAELTAAIERCRPADAPAGQELPPVAGT